MALDLAGPFTGSICDYFGHRQAALVGVIIMTLSLAAAAFATQVWQLYLTQGVLYGLGGSLTYFASLTLPSQWFTKNRGLVTGIAISGGGIGGLWISPIVSNLLSSKGFKFTMLTMSIAHFVLLVPACMFYKTRRETGRQRAKRIKQFGCRKGESLDNEKKRKFVDWTIMKDIRFSLLFVAGIFVVSGYFTPFYFINCKFRSFFTFSSFAFLFSLATAVTDQAQSPLSQLNSIRDSARCRQVHGSFDGRFDERCFGHRSYCHGPGLGQDW